MTKEQEALDTLIELIEARAQEEGYKKGYREGYEEGLQEGAKQYTVGFQDAKEVYILTIGKK